MQTRTDKHGNPISILGYGCMRFSQKAGRIDLEKTEAEILEAIRGGINYFDTAYIYPGSEAALGEILARNHLRDKVNIATKLPHYLIRSREGLEKTFAEQLSRLRTDHVDYYLMHMLTDLPVWEKLRKLGIEDWLREKKASGAIRQVGFSYHGGSDMFMKLVDAYDWDFCQIQYNYLDEHSQAGRTGLEYAAGKGLAVIIMEPLRGGRLTNNLPSAAKKLFADYEPKRSPAEWGLRWLWDQPGVTCVLSGMNSLDMVRENAAVADAARPGELTDRDRNLYAEAVKAINAKMRVGCTGCRYCMPCPHNVDIPGTFAAYNRAASDGWMRGLRDYVMCTALRKVSSAASNCVECGKCERHCPQHIAIRQELKNARKTLEGPPYKVARWYIQHVMRY